MPFPQCHESRSKPVWVMILFVRLPLGTLASSYSAVRVCVQLYAFPLIPQRSLSHRTHRLGFRSLDSRVHFAKHMVRLLMDYDGVNLWGLCVCSRGAGGVLRGKRPFQERRQGGFSYAFASCILFKRLACTVVRSKLVFHELHCVGW